MSSFFRILDEHKELLESKGYNEKQLNSPELNGLLAADLALELSNAVNEGLAFNDTVDFALRATAFFDSSVVLYKIHYRFDPQEESLNLRHLDIKWNGHRKRILLKTNRELPAAKSAFDDLKTEVSLSNKHPSKNCRKGRGL